MNDEAFTPARIIAALEVLLAQLEASLAPYITEGDTRTDFLQRQLDGFKDKTARLKTVLRKHREAQSRKRELAKQNRQNTKRR
jgi:t-SNARE complex subunit (syntaxin)